MVGTTEAGKEIYALAVHNRSLIKLQLGSGGVLPSVLTGAFSNMTDAQAAVNKYLNKEDRPIPVPAPVSDVGQGVPKPGVPNGKHES